MHIFLAHRLWLGLLVLISGCSTPNPNVNDAVMSRFLLTDSRVNIIGRTENLPDGSVRFAYPGVSASFNASGNALWLEAHSTSDQSHLEIVVDGKSHVVRLSTQSQRIPLFSKTISGKTPHHVQIIHRGETWHGVVTLNHIEVAGGELLDPPISPERQMLILGDSVTCGEAIERNAECKKDTSWWNPRLSYGMLTADALNAQVHLVCYGGRGLVRSWNGRTDELNLPDYAELTIADPMASVTWNHQQYAPDLILSAIGTNDFSQGIPERETYVATYVKLVQRLRLLHPDARIVLTEGAILDGAKKAALADYLQETKRQVADTRVYVVPSNHYPGDKCDAHPTKEQHAAMAADLAHPLKQIMQW